MKYGTINKLNIIYKIAIKNFIIKTQALNLMFEFLSVTIIYFNSPQPSHKYKLLDKTYFPSPSSVPFILF